MAKVLVVDKEYEQLVAMKGLIEGDRGPGTERHEVIPYGDARAAVRAIQHEIHGKFGLALIHVPEGLHAAKVAGGAGIPRIIVHGRLEGDELLSVPERALIYTGRMSVNEIIGAIADMDANNPLPTGNEKMGTTAVDQPEVIIIPVEEEEHALTLNGPAEDEKIH
jgi:hypothetical protein